MAKVERVVGYAGVSVVSDETGKVTHNFHTSNNKKYAVWAMLPESVLGTGKSVTFYWFKMPAETTKKAAVNHLLNGKFWSPSTDIRNMLAAVLARLEPKAKVVKQPKAKKAKTEKVTVEVKPKKELDPDTAARIAKIKAVAEKRNAEKAA